MKAVEWLLDRAEQRVKWRQARLDEPRQNRDALETAEARLEEAQAYQKRLKKDIQEYLDDWA